MEINRLLNEKLVRLEALNQLIKALKGKKIVFTNGCFDIIHPGHIHLLSEAHSFGDHLIVGLNSDESVRKLKGKNRPIKDEYSRKLTLASFFFVNSVVIFSEPTPMNLIQMINPDVLVKGGDYKESDVIGAEYVKSYGGEIKIIPLLDDYSSTWYINKL